MKEEISETGPHTGVNSKLAAIRMVASCPIPVPLLSIGFAHFPHLLVVWSSFSLASGCLLCGLFLCGCQPFLSLCDVSAPVDCFSPTRSFVTIHDRRGNHVHISSFIILCRLCLRLDMFVFEVSFLSVVLITYIYLYPSGCVSLHCRSSAFLHSCISFS